MNGTANGQSNSLELNAHPIAERGRRSSSASVSSVRTVSPSTSIARSDLRAASLAPSTSSPSLRPSLSSRRIPSNRVSHQAKPRTLSEELEEVESGYVDSFGSPRTSVVSADSRTSSTTARRRPSDDRTLSKRKSRRSSATSITTLFISTGPTPPAESPVKSIGSGRSSARHDYLGELSSADRGSSRPSNPPIGSVFSELPEDSTVPATQDIERPLLVARKFVSDLFRALLLIVTRVLWPLLTAAVDRYASLLRPPRTAHQSSVAKGSVSSFVFTKPASDFFAEKFKYIICTSFLLTPNLSIALYDTANGEAPTSTKEVDEEDTRNILRCLPSARKASPKHVTVNLRDGSITQADRLPLAPATLFHNRQIWDATIIALAILLPLSSSFIVWTRTALLATSLSWSTILIFDHVCKPQSASLSFEVLGEEGIYPTKALREAIERRNISSKLLSAAKCLVQVSQNSDIQLNKTLTAIQEVELVARGFKITHPRPPISRIEASASNGYNTSPIRRRGNSYGASGGNTARTIKGYSGVGNGEMPTARPVTIEPRRMSSLRLNFLQAVDEANQCCRAMIGELKGLVEPEELASLRVVYAVSESASEVPPAQQAWQSQGDTDAQNAPVLLPLMTGTGALGLSRGSGDVMTSGGSKRSSWGPLNPPRLLGGMQSAPIRSNTSPSPMLGDESFDNSLASFGSPKSATQLRYSLTSESSSAGINGSLSRTGSLLRRRLESHASNETSTGSATAGDMLPSGTLPSLEGRSGRGSRLSYIIERSDRSDVPGPSDPSSAKRLSYQSSDSRPESRRSSSAKSDRLDSIDLLSYRTQSSPKSTPNGHGGAWHSPAQYTSSIRRNGSLLGGSVSPAGLRGPFTEPHSSVTDDLQQQSEDRTSLLGLRQAFEQMHSLRRHALCHLLALRFSSLASKSLAREYWQKVELAIETFNAGIAGTQTRVATLLEREMNGDSHSKAAPQSKTHSETTSLQAPALPGSTGLVPFSGFEDRSDALANAIRSIQVKLRACAEELAMAQPPVLHGNASAGQDTQPSTAAKEGDVIARKDNAERIWDSLREDIVSITQEWESGSKILRAEKRKGAAATAAIGRDSDLLSHHLTAEHSQDGSLAELPSPREEDESQSISRMVHEQSSPSLNESDLITSYTTQNSDASIPSSTSEDTDLVSILLRSTNPGHLPPPGLEQVFESIADIAGGFEANGSGRKMTREERIRLVKKQREDSKLSLRQNESLEGKGGAGGLPAQVGVVTELKDVLGQIRQRREAMTPQPTQVSGSSREGVSGTSSAPASTSQQAGGVPTDSSSATMGPPFDTIFRTPNGSTPTRLSSTKPPS